MVSAGVSKLGKTSIFSVDQGVKIDQIVYREQILEHMIPEMQQLALNGYYLFQQDGARAHTAKHTIQYLQEAVPEVILPNMWPPTSPDLNPLDYSVWSSLEQKVYKVRIESIEHLKKRIVECWDSIPQEQINRGVNQFKLRMKKMIANNGKRFEHLLN